MPTFQHDGLLFHYREAGTGMPFLFQHGLGGDATQPFGLFRPPEGSRLLGLDCRAHGLTPVGDTRRLSIATMAEDCAALLEHLSIARAAVGGVSLGAAVAINFALRFPGRVRALVLSRPAWLDRPPSSTIAIYSEIAQLLRQHGPVKGAELFKQSPAYHQILRESLDSAASLLGQFTQPRAEEAVARLDIVQNVPVWTLQEWSSIRIPTLILANRQDPIHPYELAEAMARRIPGARLAELTPKSVSVPAHQADVQRHVERFLRLV